MESVVWAKYKSYPLHIPRLISYLHSLKKLRASYVKNPKNHASDFPEPRTDEMITIGESTFYMVGISHNPAAQRQTRSMKARFLAAFGDDWVWDACNRGIRDESFDWDYATTTEIQTRLKDLERALPGQGRRGQRGLPVYPARPTDTLAPSPSMDHLRELVARAPNGKGPAPETVPGIVVHSDFEGTDYSEWDSEYKEQLHAALIDVIKEHGVGDLGWAGARWLVYDQVNV